MAAVPRPNQEILNQALNIYRDSMREFLVRCLKRVPGQSLEKAVENALSFRRYDRRLNDFRNYVSRGGEVIGFIDVGDFESLIAFHWESVFGQASNDDRQSIMAHCRFAATARNRQAHPDNQDIGASETRAYLFHLARVLGSVNHPDGRHQVEELSRGIPDPDVAKLEDALGDLALKLNDAMEGLERLDTDADQNRAAIQGDVKAIEEQLQSEIERIRDEVNRKIEEASLQAYAANRQPNSEPADDDELERLESEVDRHNRLISELRSENSELRDRIETLQSLFAEIQAGTVARGADYEDEDGLEEDDDEWDDETEEADDAAVDDVQIRLDSLLRRLGQAEHNLGSPEVFPGAQYYCTQEGCNFMHGDWAGTRRAWFHKWKAVDHMNWTGHQIAEV